MLTDFNAPSIAVTHEIGSLVILRVRLRENFIRIRKQTEDLIRPLRVEDCMLSSTPETSPPKWHLAHTTWFFENFILRQWEPNFPPKHPTYHYLFNSYYESLGDFIPKKERFLLSRPTLEDVLDYRSNVDEKILSFIDQSEDLIFQQLVKTFEIGLHHEQQHQELLLMDIKRNFLANPLHPAYLSLSPRIFSQEIYGKVKQQWQTFKGGLVSIGVDSNHPQFHYDNETGSHYVWLEPFQLASHLVSNEEYLKFVEAGGYHDAKYWLSDGWECVKKNQWTAPLYWIKEKSQWLSMTLFGVQKLDLHEPVCHVSYYEAQAFASWKECRLPTESEWEVVASFEKINGAFLEHQQFHPSQTLPYSAQSSFPDIHGELWEWTQSAYLPYPHHQSFADELSEYNSKFMCNQFVLRGGSCATPRSHYRTTYRNFYQPEMRWQFSGIRLAKDVYVTH